MPLAPSFATPQILLSQQEREETGLIVHVSVLRKRKGEKCRRNKSTVKRQLVNAESSKSPWYSLSPLGTSLPQPRPLAVQDGSGMCPLDVRKHLGKEHICWCIPQSDLELSGPGDASEPPALSPAHAVPRLLAVPALLAAQPSTELPSCSSVC